MKVFRNKDLAEILLQILRFAQDFGSGLPLRSRPLNASNCQRALKMVWWSFVAVS